MSPKLWRADNAHVWEIGGLLCAPVRLVAVCKDQEAAEQIAREHNAHTALLELAQSVAHNHLPEGRYVYAHEDLVRMAQRALDNKPR